MSAERGQSSKRRCVSTACIACRRRKSKCDGNLPSCAACCSVYHTPCVYEPNSDHRRKGVYRKDADTLRTRNTTLQTLIQAILNYDEDEVFELVREIRACDDLESVAESVAAREKGLPGTAAAEGATAPAREDTTAEVDQFESELAGKMSELMLDGSRKYIGGTSNLIFLPPGSELHEESASLADDPFTDAGLDVTPVKRWTRVTDDDSLINHLMTMYFTWHYPFFTVLAKDAFYRDFVRGASSPYCSALLVNSMLALGCHFSSWHGAFGDPENPATTGNHFFKEAKRLVLENDEHENAKLCNVQAFALMSLREAGCGREGKGWVYSGLSFRMAFDLGLNLDAANLGAHSLSEEEIDARRITFWGCYLIDKCWSNYLGRQPQLSSSNASVPKFDVLPREENELWSPYTDSGVGPEHTQPSRIRAVAQQISTLCEISGDLLVFFYHPMDVDKSPPRQVELKKLSDVHTRLEAWKQKLPKELEPKEGQLPQVLVMHMFYQLLLIHLYRPFLKYTKSNTPLPPHVSPRKICTQAAAAISKLLRMYKRTYGFRQICNIAVYIAHTACTIHLLNLPDKNAQRDVVHMLKHLEEMAEGWLCARRTLRILDISANKWQVELPSEAATVFERTHSKWGSWGSWDQATSPSISDDSPVMNHNLPADTSPRHISPPEDFVPPTLQTDPSTLSNTAPLAGASMNNYPDTVPPAAPPSYPSMRAVYRSAGIQLHKPELSPPEPTYLRPISQTGYQFPIMYSPDLAVSSSRPHPNPWYSGAPNTQVHARNPSSPSAPSPVTGYDGSENLVEESQDWWSRNAAALGIGMDQWGVDSWDPATLTAQRPPQLQYDQNGGHTLVPPNIAQPQRPVPASEPQQLVQPPVAMAESGPPSAIGSGKGQPDYHDGRWK